MPEVKLERVREPKSYGRWENRSKLWAMKHCENLASLPGADGYSPYKQLSSPASHKIMVRLGAAGWEAGYLPHYNGVVHYFITGKNSAKDAIKRVLLLEQKNAKLLFKQATAALKNLGRKK